jgi:hypothetical protein
MLEDFGIEHKILSVTCDNASNNDKMVTEMEKLLTMFSSVNHTRCFTHILNLVTKSILKQFDVKKEAQGNDDDLDDDERLILELAEDIEQEEQITAQENDDADGEIEEDNDVEGWVNEVEALSPAERASLEKSIRPVKRTLVKVMRIRILHAAS